MGRIDAGGCQVGDPGPQGLGVPTHIALPPPLPWSVRRHCPIPAIYVSFSPKNDPIIPPPSRGCKPRNHMEFSLAQLPDPAVGGPLSPHRWGCRRGGTQSQISSWIIES
ncbi:hypothetical protein DICA4_D05182 [Diutina catenulata]